MTEDLANVDQRLWAAWSDFCDQLKEAGQLVFTHDGPANVLNRAAGFEYLARYLPKALDQRFNCYDTDYPQLFWLQTPTSKSFGDNPDCTYIVAWVDSAHTYRLVGNRGTVRWVSFLSQAETDNNVSNRELVTRWDGSFEITLGGEPQPDNWLRLEPGRSRILIRQFFGHWHEEEPMRLRIERTDLAGPPPPVTPESVITRLGDTIQWLRDDSEWWSRFVSFYRPQPNIFVHGLPDFIGFDGDENRLNRKFSFCHWAVEPDEALLITVTPPECIYWNFEMNNEWMNSVEYRYRLSSLNGQQAVYSPDRSVVIVLSHHDPGVPNWLDAGGFTSGGINQRWVEPDHEPIPVARLVAFADLEQALPPGTPRIDAAGRREQLRLRKIGVDRRFPV